MDQDKLDALIAFTKDSDAHARALAVAGLAKVRHPRGFASVLVTLFDPVDEVRVAAACALGLFEDDRAFEPLVSCLDDSCEQLGVNCAWALGCLPGTQAFDTLINLAADSSRRVRVRCAAIIALGQRAEKPFSDLSTQEELISRAENVLLRQLDQTNEDEIRASIFWTLGHLPADELLVCAALEALGDSYEWTLRYAIEALAHYGDKAAIGPLEDFILKANEDISALARSAIEQILSL